MASSLGKIRAQSSEHRRRLTHLQRMVGMPKPAATYARQPDRDWMLELGNILQTTLEADKLIKLFAEHTMSVVRHDSVSFEAQPQNLIVSDGTPQRYSCTYDVVLLEDFLGTITLTRSSRFSEEEIGLIEYMLIGVVHPLRNAYLYREAIRVASHDPLTGVNNRTSLDKVLDREIDLARRHLTPLSIIMIDVDRFKSINDSYGHVVGDYALKSIADCMVTCARDSDIVFRYGGEEFVIVLSNTSLDGASFLAERIRETVEEQTVDLDEAQLEVTVSLGVASFAGDDNRVRLLEKADKALYESKSRGRNCVTFTTA